MTIALHPQTYFLSTLVVLALAGCGSDSKSDVAVVATTVDPTLVSTLDGEEGSAATTLPDDETDVPPTHLVEFTGEILEVNELVVGIAGAPE